MIKHEVEWYESDDEKMFVDELDCMMYELNLLYQKSGIRFVYKNGRTIKNIDDASYDRAEFLIVDGTKKEENRKFIDRAYYVCGWAELLEIKDSEMIQKYRMLIDHLEPVK